MPPPPALTGALLERAADPAPGPARPPAPALQYKAQRLVGLSFPWPLPVDPDGGDALCSNRSRIDLHLCTPPEIEQYYKVRGWCFPSAPAIRSVARLHALCWPAPPPRRRMHSGPSLLRAPCCAAQYMLLTENPEKVPDNAWCAAGVEEAACAPGFFDAATVRGAQRQQPHACCAGYFCPPLLTCLMPCPTGAYCPR